MCAHSRRAPRSQQRGKAAGGARKPKRGPAAPRGRADPQQLGAMTPAHTQQTQSQLGHTQQTQSQGASQLDNLSLGALGMSQVSGCACVCTELG